MERRDTRFTTGETLAGNKTPGLIIVTSLGRLPIQSVPKLALTKKYELGPRPILNRSKALQYAIQLTILQKALSLSTPR